MDKLTDLQEDALIEAFNISIGKAAASLNAMVQEEIMLTVPRFEISEATEAAKSLKLDRTQDICYVSQKFKGKYFSTDALLLFAEKGSLELMRTVLGSDISLDEVGDMEQEAMKETGNVLLNACVGSLANIINDEILGSLPEIVKCSVDELTNIWKTNNKGKALLILYVDFKVESKNILGYVVFLIELNSLGDFVDEVINNFMVV